MATAGAVAAREVRFEEVAPLVNDDVAVELVGVDQHFAEHVDLVL